MRPPSVLNPPRGAPTSRRGFVTRADHVTIASVTTGGPPEAIGLKLQKTTVNAIRLVELLQERPTAPAFVSVPDADDGSKWSELRQLQNVTKYDSDDVGHYVTVEFYDRPSINYPYDQLLDVVLAEPTG